MKFNHHRYIRTKPFEYVNHKWIINGPDAAIEFVVRVDRNKGMMSCGLEIHHSKSAWEFLYGKGKEAPHHLECDVLKEPCWHAGTTTYAEEYLWQLIEPMLKHHEHDAIFQLLEEEYDKRFNKL